MRRFFPGATSCSSCSGDSPPNNFSARSTLNFHPRSAASMSAFSAVMVHLSALRANRLCSAAPFPPVRLDLRSATVNEQFDTRNEAGIIGSEKQRDLGNFLGFPHAPHRDGGHNPRNHLRRLPTHERRVDGTRTHDVGADTTVLQICRPGSYERPDGSLTCGIDAEGGRTLNTCDRAVENDRATIVQQR